MKKLICLVSVLLLTLCGCGQKELEAVEPEKEPIGYSEPLYVLASPKSSLTSIEELADKKVGVVTNFDVDLTAYVKEQLIAAGLTEYNFVETGTYRDLPFMIDDKSIAAWIIPESRNTVIQDFYNAYDAKGQKVLAEYQMPIYEETEVSAKIASDDLYTKPFAVMLMGLDEKVDPHDNPGAARNDVNLLMVVNPEKRHILTVSFPRDSFIYTVKGGYQDKLTHFSFNYGPEDVMNSIGKLLDVEVPFYTAVSFLTFTKIVDGLGGVYVDVPLDMTMDQDSNRDVSHPYSLEKGYEKLYGEWALALARNRKYGVSGGDYGRIRNQALLVNGLISKIAKYPFLIDWVEAGWFFDYVTDNNFTPEQETVLFELARSFGEGYTVDNYFIDNVGSMTESGMSIGLVTDKTIRIAKSKIALVMGEEVDETSAYYEEIMTGYVAGGAGSYADGYLGEEYDLKEVFK